MHSRALPTPIAQRRPLPRSGRGICLDGTLIVERAVPLGLGRDHPVMVFTTPVAIAIIKIAGPSRAGGVAGAALVLEQGSQSGTDVGRVGAGCERVGAFAGVLFCGGGLELMLNRNAFPFINLLFILPLLLVFCYVSERAQQRDARATWGWEGIGARARNTKEGG